MRICSPVCLRLPRRPRHMPVEVQMLMQACGKRVASYRGMAEWLIVESSSPPPPHSVGQVTKA